MTYIIIRPDLPLWSDLLGNSKDINAHNNTQITNVNTPYLESVIFETYDSHIHSSVI